MPSGVDTSMSSINSIDSDHRARTTAPIAVTSPRTPLRVSVSPPVEYSTSSAVCLACIARSESVNQV